MKPQGFVQAETLPSRHGSLASRETALASRDPAEGPDGRRKCATCGAERPASGDWLDVVCQAEGRARARCSDRMVRHLLARATPPELASPAIPVSPARGPMQLAPQFETVETENGPRTRKATAAGYHPVKVADAFDLMAVQARRRDPEAPALFTHDQVEAGRAFAELVEACAAAGYRGSWAAFDRVGGSAPSSTGIRQTEGALYDAKRLAGMRAAIGTEVALSAPALVEGANCGRAITVLELVEAVAVEGVTLSALLERRGWGKKTRPLATLRAALTAALDRLTGR